MKLPTWLEIVLAVGLVVAGIAWYRAHDAMRDALAQKDVLQHEKSDLQQQIDSAGKAEKQANKLLEAERKKPATPARINQLIPDLGKIQIGPEIPSVPLFDCQKHPEQCSSNGPNWQPNITIDGPPQKNLDVLQDFAIKCKECDNSLQARNAQFADLQKQSTLSDQNAKNWERAAKRGSGFWERAKEWGIRIAFAGGGYAAGRVVK